MKMFLTLKAPEGMYKVGGTTMTQEEKELLLKDLCCRLPYMPKIKITYQQQGIEGTDEGNVSCDFIEKIVNDLRNGVIIDIQIYLRPMSSMTEEEKKEYYTFQYKFTLQTYEYQELNKETFSEYLNWLNKNMFDYRRLIEKGLALEVTEENNPYK